MEDFDIILGMNWLSKHHARVNCYHKIVTFQSNEGKEGTFSLRKISHMLSFISYTKIKKLVQKRCLLWLVEVNEEMTDKWDLKEVLVVKEFLDVFLEGLLELPVNREIEFNIDLILGTKPISIPLYYVAPTELKELKEQL